MSNPSNPTPPLDEDERCASGQDGIHCRCWFDGDACCACGAPEMTAEAKREQGMDV